MLARPVLVAAAAIGLAAPETAAAKLTEQERIEILRGLMAENATLKTLLPRSKKPLAFHADGTWDKDQWAEAAREMGPAGRVGDMVQITKVTIEKDRILLEINGGLKSGRKWYERIEAGTGTRTTPIGMGGNPTTGSNLAVVFPKEVPATSAAEIKKMLKPILDFERRTATEQYVDTLPPEIKKAVAEQRAIEGMDREAVMLALGRPVHKTRETVDGMELEDWVYGRPPGKMVFVTFRGSKVIKVKETYAGLGGSVAPKLPPP